MVTTQNRPTGYVSVNEAATYLGMKPGEVVRLTETCQLDSVILIPATALQNYAREKR